MSVLNRIRTCPCGAWQCRIFHAARALVLPILIISALGWAYAGLQMAGVI